MPNFFSLHLFCRISDGTKEQQAAGELGKVTQAAMETFWRRDMLGFDAPMRLFNVVKQPDASVVVADDFNLIMLCLLQTHPGLTFLQATPEFQERYSQTVVVRIFYNVNKSQSGKITSAEWLESDVSTVLKWAANEEDINAVSQYFSYEHFYVIYCKFWELDTDHDFLIDREDLLRYGNHCMTHRIVDRIFAGAGRPLSSGVKDKMGYEDFIYFLLSEEDKNTAMAIKYWFRCIDLDDDGAVRSWEMEYFYSEQMKRLECLSQEVPSFADIRCQMIDMVRVSNGFGPFPSA